MANRKIVKISSSEIFSAMAEMGYDKADAECVYNRANGDEEDATEYQIKEASDIIAEAKSIVIRNRAE